jgi:hypothetical protein
MVRILVSEAKIFIEISLSALKALLLEELGGSVDQGAHDNKFNWNVLY